VARKISDTAGDGIITATVLVQAIYDEGQKLVESGVSPMALKRGIKKGVEIIIAELKKLCKPTKDKKEIEQVGTISANNDETIGKLISEAMEKVGKEGSIMVEEAKSMETLWKSWRICSSTAGTFRPTLSPIRKSWRPCSRSLTSSSMKKDHGDEGPGAVARRGVNVRQATIDHCRGCGR
jgi:hypothetical protein